MSTPPEADRLTAQTTMASNGLPRPQRHWAIAVILIGILMSVLDTSIVNIALPTLASQMNATASQSIWVINAYQLGAVILLLPLAACGEILGYRRVYLCGMAVFSLASVLCILAPSLSVLIAGRGLQGMGAAGIMSMNAALVRHTYPHRTMGRALGLNAFVIGVSAAAAPTVAAGILSIASWRWLFGINVPFCIFCLAAGLFVLPDNPLRRRVFDFPSALISALLFGALVVGADTICRDVGSRLGWGLIGLSACCAYLVVRRSWTQTAPLFPTDLLRIPLFGLSITTSIASFASQTMAAVSLPFMLQRGLGRSIIETGILLTPWPIASAVCAATAGFLADKIRGAILNSGGLVTMAAGFFLLATMPPDIDNFGIVWRIAICGAGFGFFQSPNNRTLVLAAPRARSGATGGALATARTTAQCLGAVLVVLLFQVLPLGSASRWALAVAGGMALVAAVISSLRLGHVMTPEQD